MDLKKASRWFDDILITDGYSDAALYKGQISAVQDNNADGTISRRRTLSLDPDLAIPPRRVIGYLGERWIVGDGLKDGLQGQALRQSFRMQKVNERYTLCTPGQAALGTGGANVYGQKLYLKSLVNSMSDAEYDPFWEITVAQTEEALKGYFLVSNLGEYYRIRARHDLIEGFRILEADQIDDGCYVEVLLQPATLDPITQVRSGSVVATSGVLLDAYQAYEYRTQADPKYTAGDKILILAKISGTPVVGQQVSAGGRAFTVFSSVAEIDAWKCLLRPA